MPNRGKLRWLYRRAAAIQAMPENSNVFALFMTRPSGPLLPNACCPHLVHALP